VHLRSPTLRSGAVAGQWKERSASRRHYQRAVRSVPVRAYHYAAGPVPGLSGLRSAFVVRCIITFPAVDVRLKGTGRTPCTWN
jgi:hypothetical protein